MHLVMPTLPYSPTHLKETDLNRAVPLCILLLFCAFLQEKRGYPTPENAILHPILHPKSPVNTGILGYGCRKCRIFFQNFFRGGEKRHWSGGLGGRFTKLIYRTPLKNIGLLWAKVRMFCIESTDVCLKEVRCFWFPKRGKYWISEKLQLFAGYPALCFFFLVYHMDSQRWRCKIEQP